MRRDHDAPEQKQDCLRRAGDRKHVDNGGNEYEGSYLKYGREEKDQRPQSCAGQSPDHEAETGENRLDHRDTENSIGDTPYRGSGEVFELRTAFTKQAVGQRTRGCRASRSIRKQNSRNQN